ncbi:MAG: M48 family metallopeptidase [Kangiellaceae bacterium]|nr:M48 family metallopeptidase [Kangiellaceae bacterium]MCW9017123.1 M48 family metallopeptidase [Kangiellaceae bacterium]
MSESIFVDGHGFHDNLPGGRSSGSLSISQSHIRFETKSEKVEFPIQGARVTLGGASDRLVFFSHPAKPDWKVYTADRSVLRLPQLKANPNVNQQLHKAKRRRVFNWSVFAAICLIIVGAPLFLIFSMDRITGWIAPNVPAEWEQELGQSVWAQISIEHQILENEQAVKRLDEFIAPLLDAAKSERYQYRVAIVNDPQINAFALPGGYIAINSGLILAAESGEEVLGVLAHEISHVTHQHGIRSLMGNVGIFITVQALFGDVSGLLGAVANAAPLLLNQSYSRGFETEADDAGFELLSKAKIPQEGLVSFFERLKALEEEKLKELGDEQAALWLKGSLGLLSSHPATQDRIEAMRQKLADSKQYDSFNDEVFQQLKREVEAFTTDYQSEADKNNEE